MYVGLMGICVMGLEWWVYVGVCGTGGCMCEGAGVKMK